MLESKMEAFKEEAIIVGAPSWFMQLPCLLSCMARRTTALQMLLLRCHASLLKENVTQTWVLHSRAPACTALQRSGLVLPLPRALAAGAPDQLQQVQQLRHSRIQLCFHCRSGSCRGGGVHRLCCCQRGRICRLLHLRQQPLGQLRLGSGLRLYGHAQEQGGVERSDSEETALLGATQGPPNAVHAWLMSQLLQAGHAVAQPLPTQQASKAGSCCYTLKPTAGEAWQAAKAKLCRT